MDASAWHARFTQQATWTANLRHHLFDKAGLRGGERLLEVGCGTGAVLSTLADHLPPLCLHGLDIHLPYLRLANIHNPSAFLAQGDALALPYATNSFAAVFCHYLLLWVSNPLLALREMARVTLPGGWVFAFAEPDYGGRIDYPPVFEIIGQLQEKALLKQGATTRLGRRLGALFHQAGFVNVTWGVLGGEWRHVEGDEEWRSEWLILEYDLRDEVTPTELATWREKDRIARHRGERLLFVPTFFAAGQKG